MENLFSSRAPHIFLIAAMTQLIVWSANGDRSALPSRSICKMTIPTDGCVRPVILRIKRESCALKKDILDSLNEKNVSGAFGCKSSL